MRWGGEPGPEGFRFELSGGRLCLDFANTVDNRPTAEARELLGSYEDLLSWGRQAGILAANEERTLLRSARRRPSAARRALARARAFREAIFEIFSAEVSKTTPPANDIALVESEIASAFREPALRRKSGAYEICWAGRTRGLDRFLGPVARSAAELFTSPDLARVRICAADTCGWLFLDASRNGSRQWCDMSVCGNRAKARRFYARTRKIRRRESRDGRRSRERPRPP